MALNRGENITYRRTGRDLVRFARNIGEHYAEFHVMSKLRVSVMSAGGGATNDEALVKWMMQRTPLLWILLFEDKVSVDE
jgi:hypothetical protein